MDETMHNEITTRRFSYRTNEREKFASTEKTKERRRRREERRFEPGVTEELEMMMAPSVEVTSFNLLSLLVLRKAIRGLFEPGILIVVRCKTISLP